MCIGPVVGEGQGWPRPPPDVRLCAVSPVRCWLRQSAEPQEVQQEGANSVALAAQVNLRGLGTRQIPARANESRLCLWPVRRGFWPPEAVFFLFVWFVSPGQPQTQSLMGERGRAECDASPERR